MLAASLKQEIDAVLETTLMMAPKGTPLKELARRAYTSDRKVFDQVQETWMLERHRMDDGPNAPEDCPC